MDLSFQLTAPLERSKEAGLPFTPRVDPLPHISFLDFLLSTEQGTGAWQLALFFSTLLAVLWWLINRAPHKDRAGLAMRIGALIILGACLFAVTVTLVMLHNQDIGGH